MTSLDPALNHLRGNPALAAGLGLLALLGLAALVGPVFVDPTLAQVGATLPRQPPTAAHWLGTDAQGRDVLTAMTLAMPQTLKIGLIAGLISLTVGVALGLVAGFTGGIVDTAIRTASDVMMTIPGVAVLVLVAANVRTMTVELMAVIVAGLSWMVAARAIRAQTLSLRERGYVQVARLNGLSGLPLIFVEVLPNLLPYIAASFVLTVGQAMLATIGLEALGLGPQNELTLGMTIFWAQFYGAVIRGMWWWWGPPILALALIFVAPAPELRGDGPPHEQADRGFLMAAVWRSPAVRRLSDGARPAPPPWTASASASRHGERFGLVGESGSGKSTTVLALMRMIKPPGRSSPAPSASKGGTSWRCRRQSCAGRACAGMSLRAAGRHELAQSRA
jgi:peptide/nickel transport system permease protein